jgi:DNA-binding phage protein
MTGLALHPRLHGDRAIALGPVPGPAQAACDHALALTAALVGLIERHGLSVAAPAKTIGIDVAAAGVLVRLWAIEREAQETELDEYLDRIQELCPGEDWWSYTPRQLDSIARGDSIPNRIVRELTLACSRRTQCSMSKLARDAGIDDQRLRRALGISAMPPRRNGGPHRQKTITVECATRIVRALGIPPCEIPGL